MTVNQSGRVELCAKGVRKVPVIFAPSLSAAVKQGRARGEAIREVLAREAPETAKKAGLCLIAESNRGEPDGKPAEYKKQKPHELKELWGEWKKSEKNGSVKQRGVGFEGRGNGVRTTT